MKTIMLQTRLVAAVLAFFFIAQSCSAQTALPAHWADNMKLTMSYGGGMRYYSYTIEFTKDGGRMEVNDQGSVKQYKLELSGRQQDDMLKYLNEKNFLVFKSEPGPFAHDKGTQSIYMTWGDKTYGATESASNRITEKYRMAFGEVETYLMELATKNRKEVN